MRGYDTQAVVLFDDTRWGNYQYLKQHFGKLDLSTFDLPLPPPRRDNAYDDEQSMEEYYEKTAETPAVANLLELLQQKHFSRISKLTSMRPMPSQSSGIPSDNTVSHKPCRH